MSAYIKKDDAYQLAADGLTSSWLRTGSVIRGKRGRRNDQRRTDQEIAGFAS